MTDIEYKLADALRAKAAEWKVCEKTFWLHSCGPDCVRVCAHDAEELLAAYDSARAQPASVPDGRVRLAAIETKLRERGVVDVKFDFAKMDASLSQVANDCADMLEAVLAKRTRKFTGLGDYPAQPAIVPDDRDAKIYAEIDRAVAMFPTWPTDPLHALAVLGEEYGELTKAVLQAAYEPHKNPPFAVHDEAIQTAAMAIRFVRSLGRYRFVRCQQHTQAAPQPAKENEDG